MSRNWQKHWSCIAKNVAPREGRVSRNRVILEEAKKDGIVAPREGRVSRNFENVKEYAMPTVAPREGRVSRNYIDFLLGDGLLVAPREGRVSRNYQNSMSQF